MADSKLIQLAGSDRNPIQDEEFQALLKGSGYGYTVDGGKTNVAGFGFGGNNAMDQARSFFAGGKPMTQASAVGGSTLDATNAAQKAAMDARFAQNKAELQGFNDRYGAAVPAAINAASDKYQLGTLLGQTNALNTRIKTLGGNLDSSGAGGYASGAQVDRAINTKYMPTYQTAVQNFQTGSTLANQEAQMAVKPYEVEGNLLNDRLAREATGYTTQQQGELDALIAKMQTDAQLTIAEMNRMTALAQLEQDKYLREKEIALSKEIATINNTANEQNRYLNGSTFYDTQTGQWVKAPTSGTGNGTDITKYFNTSTSTGAGYTPPPTFRQTG